MGQDYERVCACVSVYRWVIVTLCARVCVIVALFVCAYACCLSLSSTHEYRDIGRSISLMCVHTCTVVESLFCGYLFRARNCALWISVFSFCLSVSVAVYIHKYMFRQCIIWPYFSMINADDSICSCVCVRACIGGTSLTHASPVIACQDNLAEWCHVLSCSGVFVQWRCVHKNNVSSSLSCCCCFGLIFSWLPVVKKEKAIIIKTLLYSCIDDSCMPCCKYMSVVWGSLPVFVLAIFWVVIVTDGTFIYPTTIEMVIALLFYFYLFSLFIYRWHDILIWVVLTMSTVCVCARVCVCVYVFVCVSLSEWVCTYCKNFCLYVVYNNK